MPGLVRGVARTAVAAGTATAVSGRVQRRQAEKFADRDAQIASTRATGWVEGAQAAAPPPQQAAPPPQQAAPAQPDKVEQLKGLAALRDQGILTEEEFAAEKAKILAT